MERERFFSETIPGYLKAAEKAGIGRHIKDEGEVLWLLHCYMDRIIKDEKVRHEDSYDPLPGRSSHA